MIKESDEYLMWKNIPKAQRERLTKKQLMRVMKPDLLSEGLALQVMEAKPTMQKKVQDSSKAPEVEVPAKTSAPSITQSAQLPQKSFKNEPPRPAEPKMAAGDTFKVRTKPRKIVVEERDENNQIVR